MLGGDKPNPVLDTYLDLTRDKSRYQTSVFSGFHLSGFGVNQELGTVGQSQRLVVGSGNSGGDTTSTLKS